MMKIMYRDVIATNEYEEITLEQLQEKLETVAYSGGLRPITLEDIQVENGVTVMYYGLDLFEC